MVTTVMDLSQSDATVSTQTFKRTHLKMSRCTTKSSAFALRVVGIFFLAVLLSVPVISIAREKNDRWLDLAKQYDALIAAEKYEEGVNAARTAIQMATAEFGAKSIYVAIMTEKLASAYMELNRNEEALPLLEQALTTAEQVRGKSHIDTVKYLLSLSGAYIQLKRWDRALQIHQRTLFIVEKVRGSLHPSALQELEAVISCYVLLDQHEKALPLQLELLKRLDSVEPPNTEMILQTLDKLLDTYGYLTKTAEGLPFVYRLLNRQRETYGIDSSHAVATETRLANWLLLEHDIDGSQSVLQNQHKRLVALYGADHPKTATALLGLSAIPAVRGEFDEALRLQEGAVEILARTPDHEDYRTALAFYAATLELAGKLDRALEVETQVYQLARKANPIGWDTGTSLHQMAKIRMQQGEYAEALPLQLRAIAIKESIYYPSSEILIYPIIQLGAIYFELGQIEKSRQLFLRAYWLSLSVHGANHKNTAFASWALAQQYISDRHFDFAIALLKNSVNAYQAVRKQIEKLSNPLLNTFTRNVAFAYQDLAKLLINQGRLSEAETVLDMLKEDEQFDFVRRSNEADRRHSRVGYTVKEQQLVTKYGEISERLGAIGAEERNLEKLAKRGLTIEQKERLKRLRAESQAAEFAFFQFIDKLQKDLASNGTSKSAEELRKSEKYSGELLALVSSLGEDVALLRYYITEHEVGMLLTTSGIKIARNFAIDRKDLDAQIAGLRRSLRDPKTDPLPMAKNLYKILLGPVEGDLVSAGVKTLMLSPDGNLRYLAFGALHDGNQYAARRWNLPIFTSVTKDKLRDAVTPSWKVAGLGVTRAMGEFKALPAVKGEIDGVMRSSASKGMPGEVYLDEQFTATRLKDVGQRNFQLMHVSSHFVNSPGTEVNSFLLLGDGQHLSLGDIRTQNYRFDQVDLLTLSACDTGLGGELDANGKEIEGLGVIAQQQGAKAVLATLWPVADQSTATLMADMYQRRQTQSLSKIEALRQAQLALMAQPKYAHPFYWAPFILMGNWK